MPNAMVLQCNIPAHTQLAERLSQLEIQQRHMQHALDEQRTELTEQRAELTEKRTELDEHRTEITKQRTALTTLLKIQQKFYARAITEDAEMRLLALHPGVSLMSLRKSGIRGGIENARKALADSYNAF